MQINKIMAKTISAIFLLLIVCVSIVPFLWVFASSFKSNADIMSAAMGFPNGLKFINYKNAFKLAPIDQFYINSIIVTFFGILLNVSFASAAAYVLARFSFKGARFLTVMLSMGLFIPGAALLQPLFQIISKANLSNSHAGLVIVYSALGLATTLYVMISYFKTIPKELEESAYIEGSGFVNTFFRIILPLTRPALSTAAVIQFLLCWNEFQFALILTSDNNVRTLPIALYYFKSSFASDYGAMFAATILVICPSIIVFILLQKQVVRGLVAGSVKG